MISHEGSTEKERIEVSVPDHKYLEVMGIMLATYLLRCLGRKSTLSAYFLKAWDCLQLKNKSFKIFLNDVLKCMKSILKKTRDKKRI